MTSESTNQPVSQANQSPQASPSAFMSVKPEVPQMPSLSPQYGNPVAQEIAKNLQSGADPLAFINQNLKQKESSAAVITKVAEEAAVEHVLITPPDPFAEKKPETPAPPSEGEAPADDALPPEEITSDEQLESADKSSLQTSYRNLLKKHRENEERLRLEAEAKTQLEERVKKFETGEELPEVVKELQERVNQLEPLEALVDLKKSPAYQAKFVEPLAKVTEKITGIAKDYEVPPHIMEEALELRNRADLNRFLLNHFDEVGALEIKQLISEAQGIKDAATAAEAKPKTALAQLQSEHAHMKQLRDAERGQTIANNSRSAWERAVIKIQKEGRVQELTPRINDTLFNDNYVKPIMHRAAQEYGKVIRTLAENGLESLPDELAEALANSCLLSIASAVSVERANAAESYANELHQNTERRNGMLRPSMGSNGTYGAGGGQPPPSQPQSPIEAGRFLVNKVLSTPG